MPAPTDINHNILTGIRTLLMLFGDLTASVGARITPNQFAGADQQQPAVMLELRDCQQQNTIDRSGCLITGTLVITIRTKDDLLCDQLAEIIRSNGTVPSTGLDGYSGPAGTGQLLSAERTDFDTTIVYDDDGDETDQYDSVQIYRIHYAMGA